MKTLETLKGEFTTEHNVVMFETGGDYGRERFAFHLESLGHLGDTAQRLGPKTHTCAAAV
jgi:hypothetical protein